MAVGEEAVALAKIQTSMRVAFCENTANCTLLPVMVAPRGVWASAGAVEARPRTIRDAKIPARSREAKPTFMAFISWKTGMER